MMGCGRLGDQRWGCKVAGTLHGALQWMGRAASSVELDI